ncbi:MAG: Terminase small subunit [bacterium ADurb.Bin212]|nr:MAG: Terminase small subunit [bacterium ADurb.Bin212]
MKKRITQKQKKFVDEYLTNGSNGVQAALVAYETKNYKTASKLACTNLSNPKITDMIEKALSKNNINADTIAEKLSDGLNAKRIMYDGKTGSFVMTDFADFNIQHKFLSLVIDIVGLKAPEKREVKMQGVLGIEQVESIRARVFGN